MYFVIKINSMDAFSKDINPTVDDSLITHNSVANFIQFASMHAYACHCKKGYVTLMKTSLQQLQIVWHT